MDFKTFARPVDCVGGIFDYYPGGCAILVFSCSCRRLWVIFQLVLTLVWHGLRLTQQTLSARHRHDDAAKQVCRDSGLHSTICNAAYAVLINARKVGDATH